MASRSEDLEFNPFYQALQTKFLSQYEQAQQQCWLVCVPRAASLASCTINKQFVEMHLLQPSAFLRDRYKSTVNGQQVIWQLTGNTLEKFVNSKSEPTPAATVLGEELAYNRSLEQYKMFILDRPLDPNYKPTAPRHSGGKVSDMLRPRRTFSEHRELLWSFSNHLEVMKELDSKIASFIQNYLIVDKESLLLDTAQKLETIIKQTSTHYMEANRQDSRLHDRRVQEAVWISIEGYLLSSVHAKVFSAVCRVYSREDRRLRERCQHLRAKLTPSVVGVHSDYECPYPKTLGHLNRLELCHSPLEKLYCLQDAMESVMQDAKENFTNTLRLGEPQPLASDDLIALLATIIVQSSTPYLFSSLYYMEYFHWSATDADKLSYVLVTFRAAVEYIRGQEVEHLLPEKEAAPVKRELAPPPPPPSFSPLSEPRHTSPVSQALDESITSLRAGAGHKERQGTRSRERTKPAVENSELGPFLSMLVESEDTISSSVFYDNSY